MKRLLIIGLGEIGLANARYLKGIKELDVHGYDINPQAVTNAANEGLVKPAVDFSDFDIYMLCVSTHDPKDMTKPDLRAIHNCLDTIWREGKEGSLVAVESTVPLGVCRHAGNLLRGKIIHLVHTPHRYWKESEDHGVNQTRVMGAFDECCAKVGQDFYEHVLGIQTFQASNLETAEASKVVENMHRCVDIALAQEIRMFAEQNGLDFDELKRACETKWNIRIMDARDGIFGHCLRKDTMMFVNAGGNSKSIARAALELDDLYRQYRTPREKFLESKL